MFFPTRYHLSHHWTCHNVHLLNTDYIFLPNIYMEQNKTVYILAVIFDPVLIFSHTFVQSPRLTNSISLILPDCICCQSACYLKAFLAYIPYSTICKFEIMRYSVYLIACCALLLEYIELRSMLCEKNIKTVASDDQDSVSLSLLVLHFALDPLWLRAQPLAVHSILMTA